MDCKSAEKLFDAWLDGELDPGRAVQLREHMHACPACSRIVEQMRRFNEMLDAQMPIQPPSGLLDQTLEAFKRETGVQSLTEWWRGMSLGMRGAACGLAVAGILLGFVMAGTLSSGGDVNQYYTQLAALDTGGLWQ